MEAANRGAFEAGCRSIGLNITLPFEQHPNPYITPDLCFKFNYFSLRKFHFVMRSIGAILFPGCLLYTSPSPRDVEESRMPSSA